MIFPSYIFFLLFLPAVLIGWYAIRAPRWRLAFLTAASYLFYGWWDYRFVVLMIATTVLDYICGRAIYLANNQGRRRFWLIASMVGNLGSLGFFKYFNFFTDSLTGLLTQLDVAAPLPVLNVVLPIGISFYTFQSMSYSIDIYRRKCKPTNDLLTFTAYVSMFPQLVAGPIVRYECMEEQLRTLKPTTPPERIADGVWLFVIGLVKKVWIADTLAPMAEYAFDSVGSPGLFTAWAGTFAYTFQLYFDFSAYSDMARGLGLMLGFDFPINFDSPYKSGDISEFWRRWHITLSQWLRDYLFIPLGGSKGKMLTTLRNLGVVMFLGGLWHGAAWTFVAWGIYHGLLLVGFACWARLSPVRLPRVAGVAATLLLVMVGWVIFRANSMGGAVEVLAGLVGMNGVEPLNYTSTTFGISLPSVYGMFGGAHGVVFLALVTSIALFAPNSQQLPRPKHPVCGAALACVMLIALTTFSTEAPFLYFEF